VYFRFSHIGTTATADPSYLGMTGYGAMPNYITIARHLYQCWTTHRCCHAEARGICIWLPNSRKFEIHPGKP